VKHTGMYYVCIRKVTGYEAHTTDHKRTSVTTIEWNRAERE